MNVVIYIKHSMLIYFDKGEDTPQGTRSAS